MYSKIERGEGFQFLIGRLGTAMRPSRRWALMRFQFLIGRLGTSALAGAVSGIRAVSIPHR